MPRNPLRNAVSAGSRPSNVVDLTQRVASDEELMRRTAEGDQAAIAELVRRGGELAPIREEAFAA